MFIGCLTAAAKIGITVNKFELYLDSVYALWRSCNLYTKQNKSSWDRNS